MRTSKITVTVDAVVINKMDEFPMILLIQRLNEPFKDSWALPGGFVDENEDLQIAALRELREETGILLDSMVQLSAFGKPGRDPRGHTVSIAYLGYAAGNTIPKAADDAADARWFSLKDLPELAFDHSEIINFAIQKVIL